MAVRILIFGAVAFLGLWRSSAAEPPGDFFEVSYPASPEPGELSLGVTYTVWIPAGVEKLRGVIVHQHGCGSGACKGGATAAYDLHWQALARKWNCALLGPSYQQQDSENCRLWCDPRNGSARAFLRGLHELGEISGHSELAAVPWCLWGHSGGGFWASLLQTLYPERIVAIWFRSGTAIEVWERGEIPRPEIPADAAGIPMMCNPGAGERDDVRFRGAWTGAERMFHFYREQNAPIGMALDPKSNHECADSRYLAIPFFDACLALRLPDAGSADQRLRPIDPEKGWLAPFLAGDAVPAQKFQGERLKATWLPTEAVAQVWQSYVATGFIEDDSDPPAPTALVVTRQEDGWRLEWQAEPDFETGLAGFLILRNGVELARLPEKSTARFGKPLFQSMSYHDTPEKPLPQMQFLDRTVPIPDAVEYQIVTVNAAGRRSPPSQKSSGSRAASRAK